MTKTKILQCFAAMLITIASIPHASSDDHVNVEPDHLEITLPAGESVVVVTNYHARMKSIAWAKDGEQGELKITPLVDAWEIRSPKANKERVIKLMLADTPRTTQELEPIAADVDGAFTIPAHQAHVVGEKLRYELQPWKNTVGYWVNSGDFVYFLVQVNSPGSWNVAILQGCGGGQGGSEASMSLHGPIQDEARYAKDQVSVSEAIVDQLDFVVKETGHFQNFQWRHIGTTKIENAGVYAVKISARKIAKNAVMDLRAISLTRIPK